MTPTSKKLSEHIGFGLSVRACARPSVIPFVIPFVTCVPYLMNRACYGFEISCMDSSWKQ